MAKRKPVESFSDTAILFEHDHASCRVLRLDPNTMNVTLLRLVDGKELTLPFAHLPKTVKKQIRPL